MRLACRSEKYRLELAQFTCERLHQLRFERLLVKHDAEAVAAQRPLGEDIADVELEFHLAALRRSSTTRAAARSWAATPVSFAIVTSSRRVRAGFSPEMISPSSTTLSSATAPSRSANASSAVAHVCARESTTTRSARAKQTLSSSRLRSSSAPRAVTCWPGRS